MLRAGGFHPASSSLSSCPSCPHHELPPVTAQNQPHPCCILGSERCQRPCSRYRGTSPSLHLTVRSRGAAGPWAGKFGVSSGGVTGPRLHLPRVGSRAGKRREWGRGTHVLPFHPVLSPMTCISCCQLEGGERGWGGSESEASVWLLRLCSWGTNFREGLGAAGRISRRCRPLPALGHTVFPRSHPDPKMQGKGLSSPQEKQKRTTKKNPNPKPAAAPGFPWLPAALTHLAEPPLSLPKPAVLRLLPGLSQPRAPRCNIGVRGLPSAPAPAGRNGC